MKLGIPHRLETLDRECRVYIAYLDAVNYERLVFRHTDGKLAVIGEAAGTGDLEKIQRTAVAVSQFINGES